MSREKINQQYDIFQRLYYFFAFAGTVRSLFTPKGRWDQLGFMYVIFLNLWNVTSFGYFATQLPDLIHEKKSSKKEALFLLTAVTHFLMLGATVWSTVSSTQDFIENKNTFLNSDVTLGKESALFCNSFSYFLSMMMMAINAYHDYPETKSDHPLNLNPEQFTALRIYKTVADGACSASALFSAISVYFLQREALFLSVLFCAVTTAMNVRIATNRILHRGLKDPVESDLQLTELRALGFLIGNGMANTETPLLLEGQLNSA